MLPLKYQKFETLEVGRQLTANNLCECHTPIWYRRAKPFTIDCITNGKSRKKNGNFSLIRNSKREEKLERKINRYEI